MPVPPHPSGPVTPATLSAKETVAPAGLVETPAQAGAMARLIALFPAGQFVRYLCTGVWNTVFGFSTYALFVSLLGHLLPLRWLALTALLASLLSTPINITMAFFCYKLIVFRTKGNYLGEWLRCFAVYGTSMIPGLLALSGLTRLFQALLTSRHALLAGVANLLPSVVQDPLRRVAHGGNLAAYLAGALLMAFTTIFSFIGHKTFSFKQKKSTPPEPDESTPSSGTPKLA